MNLTQFLSIVFARWRLAAVVMLLVVTVVTALTWRMPKRFESTAAVVVDVSRADGPMGGGWTGAQQQKVYVATQIEVLNSRRVADEVVATLGEEDRQWLAQDWATTGKRGSFENWAADTLREGLKVAPARESNVVNVSYVADDAARAARLANAFVARYVDIAVALRVQPAQKYREFFEEQAKAERARLETARARLDAFNAKRGILATDSREDVESTRLAELMREIVAIETQLAAANSRANAATGRAAQLEEVQRDPLIVGMRADLQRARTELALAGERLGSNHPRMIELNRSIADLEARIGAESARIRSTLNVNANALSARLATLRAAADAQRAKVAKLAAARSEASLLIADVAAAQRTFDEVVNRLSQTRLESQATQGNVSILEEAQAPLLPSSPNVALNIAAGVFIGTLLGILLGIGRELLDRRIRTEDHLMELVEQQLIGSVPSFSGSRARALGINPRRALSGTPRRLPAS